MEKIDQILDSLYDRVIEPMEAKEQLLDLFAVMPSLPDDVVRSKEQNERMREWFKKRTGKDIPLNEQMKEVDIMCKAQEVLQTLYDSIKFIETEHNANYVITTEDIKIIESCLKDNKYKPIINSSVCICRVCGKETDYDLVGKLCPNCW